MIKERSRSFTYLLPLWLDVVCWFPPSWFSHRLYHPAPITAPSSQALYATGRKPFLIRTHNAGVWEVRHVAGIAPYIHPSSCTE